MKDLNTLHFVLPLLCVFLIWIEDCSLSLTKNNSWKHLILDEASTNRTTLRVPNAVPEREITNSRDQMDDGRNSRFFLKGFSNIFRRFRRVPNRPCKSPTGEQGICYRKEECTRNGGTPSGSCQGGIGYCCIFVSSCGATTNQNCTYFVNEDYPSAYDGVGSCQLVVNKMNDDVCQIRLDFEDFNIAQPDAQTVCTNDRFTVSNGSPTPTICGLNTGNHMYISLGSGVTTPTILSFITMGASFSRKWKVKVTQIPCNTDYSAPSNCLQYYTGITGTIKSYNYDLTSGRQLARQDYTSCIRAERSFCGIQYTPCDDPDNTANPQSFTLSGLSGEGSLKGTSCTTDWIIIPCSLGSSTAATSTCLDRYCGRLLNFGSTSSSAGNAPLFTSVKPFTLMYHTDTTEVGGETDNRGYCLNYVQQPCA